VTATPAKLVYTLVFDNSMLADAAARERNKEQRTATFTRALQNMKTIAEGGTLPPPAPRRGGPGAAPPLNVTTASRNQRTIEQWLATRGRTGAVERAGIQGGSKDPPLRSITPPSARSPGRFSWLAVQE
jgi:hypothetical protein